MDIQTKNVLMVEDNPDHAELALSTLQTFSKQHEQKFQVNVVRTGKECLFSLTKDTYDVVVMDYSLPMMDGIEVLKKIRENGVKTPVIMLTGRGSEKIAVEAIKKGASEYLVKDQGYLGRLPWVMHASIEEYERRKEKEGLEEEIKQYQIDLEMSRRLASIGEMVSRIAHEIKNPLSKIKIGIDFLKKSLHSLDNTSTQMFDCVLDGVENLNKIAVELLNYAKSPAPSFRQLDIHEILNTSLDDLTGRLKNSGVRLVRKYHKGPKSLRVDGVKLKEVFLNLIENAIDAMSGGGTLTVCTNWVQRENNRFMEICFSDTGQGISEGNLEKVFAPFFTTKPTGTGLGLAVVKKNIEIHNGKIEIKSPSGKGTTVTLLIPERINI